jgi:hypothetical protein
VPLQCPACFRPHCLVQIAIRVNIAAPTNPISCPPWHCKILSRPIRRQNVDAIYYLLAQTWIAVVNRKKRQIDEHLWAQRKWWAALLSSICHAAETYHSGNLCRLRRFHPPRLQHHAAGNAAGQDRQRGLPPHVQESGHGELDQDCDHRDDDILTGKPRIAVRRNSERQVQGPGRSTLRQLDAQTTLLYLSVSSSVTRTRPEPPRSAPRIPAVTASYTVGGSHISWRLRRWVCHWVVIAVDKNEVGSLFQFPLLTLSPFGFM